MVKIKVCAAACAAMVALSGTIGALAASVGSVASSSRPSSAVSSSRTPAASKAAASSSSKAPASSSAAKGLTASASSKAASASSKTASSQPSQQPPSSGNDASSKTVAKPALPEPVLKAKSVILAEQSTGKILYEKNAHEKLPPASITKIMTELLTLEAIDSGKLKWGDMLTCSEHAASMGGSDIWLEPKEQMSVRDLFKAMAVSSANDAAVVFAEKIGGSEQGFVTMMNQRAKELGMNDTNFVNANGLDADGHVTSAYDIMLMSRELEKHKEIFDYCTIWMDSVRNGKTQLVNTNRLVRFYSGITGLKTGSTGKAGYCISATAARDGMSLIAVTMASDNSDDRFKSASALLDYGFGGWSVVKAQASQKKYSARVINGEKYNVTATVGDMPSVLVLKGGEKGVTQKVSMVRDVAAPVEKGQVLGQITLWQDGKNVGSVPVKADFAVPKMSLGKAFLYLMGTLSS